MRIHRARGFTMLELVLVMLVVAMVMAMVAPSLRGWSRGAKLRDAADEFVAVASWARGQAAAKAVLHRLEVDAEAGTYRVTVQRGEEFVAAPGEFGQPTALPQGVRIELSSTSGEDLPGAGIDFQPNGRATPARVRFFNDRGDALEVASSTAAEPLQTVAQVTP